MKQDYFEKLLNEFGSWVLDVSSFSEEQCALVYDMLSNLIGFINYDIIKSNEPILDIGSLPNVDEFIMINQEVLKRKGRL